MTVTPRCKRNNSFLLVIATFTLIYFPLFLNLDYLPFRMWDEARPAIHAYEMLMTGNFLDPTHEGEIDMWYTKPPLLAWLQALSIKLLGFSELAVRLPTAIAAAFTCLLIGYIVYSNSRSLLWGCLSAIVLATMGGYVCVHGSRTGDTDVLLAFFMLLNAFSAYQISKRFSIVWVYVFFIALLGGFLSKGIAGFFFLPSIFVYIIMQKETLIKLLKSYHFYTGFFALIVIIISYYLLREVRHPGYIQAVYDNELLGRYTTTIEKHEHSFFYYWERILTTTHPLWLVLFIIGISMALYNVHKPTKKFLLFPCMLTIQYILLVSFSQTKAPWYDIPVYPLMAILISYSLYNIFGVLRDKLDVKEYYTVNFIPVVFLIVSIAFPYINIYTMIAKKGEPEYWHEQEYSLSNYLRNRIKETDKNLDGNYLCVESYHGHLLPYIYQLRERGQRLTFLENYKEAKPGDILLAHQDIVKQEIERIYNYKIIYSENYVVQYLITEKTDNQHNGF